MKLAKKLRRLEERRAGFDKLTRGKPEEWPGYHRPGGTPKQGEHRCSQIVFRSVSDAVERLQGLGFTSINVADRLIVMTGKLTLGMLKAADYLVNYHKFMWVKAEVSDEF